MEIMMLAPFLPFLIIIAVIVVVSIVSTYNGLVKSYKQIEQSKSLVDVYLKKRFDLIPNLMECVKGYMKHEKEVIMEVTKLRMSYAEGAPIRIRPWDFKENKTLCPDCEKWLEETHNSREDGRLLEEVVDDSLDVRVMKPWDIRDFERENAVDNVLLWD